MIDRYRVGDVPPVAKQTPGVATVDAGGSQRAIAEIFT